MITFNYIASFFLIALGFYTIITKFNIVKTVIGLSIADYGVNLLIISIGYVPGGTAAYPSTVLMDAIPAKIAGCSEIVMVSPPNSEGRLNPAILVPSLEKAIPFSLPVPISPS